MRPAFILLTYNSTRWLEKCLSTLLTTVPENAIFVCVDNGSSDDTVKMLKKLIPHAHLICNHRNLGYARAMNIGARAALKLGAEVLVFLNPDVWFEKGWFEPLVEELKDPQTGACGPYQLEYDSSNPSKWSKTMLGDTPPHSSVEVNWIEGSCFLIRSEVFLKAGEFYEGFFMYFEDEHLCRVLRCMGLKCIISPKSLFHHHSSSLRYYHLLIRSLFVLNLTDPSSSFLNNLFSALRTLLLHIRDALKSLNFSQMLQVIYGFFQAFLHLHAHYRRWKADKKRCKAFSS